VTGINTPGINRQVLWDKVAEFFQVLVGPDGSGKPFRTFYKSAKAWAVVPPENCPSINLDPINEIWKVRQGLPPKIWANALLRLYVITNQEGDDILTVDANALLNPLIDAVCNSIIIDDLASQCATLGGRVSHCAIEGKLERFSGSLGNEAVAVIPITIVVSP
jgi:hypothetical protein